jgi:hypothetical protein
VTGPRTAAGVRAPSLRSRRQSAGQPRDICQGQYGRDRKPERRLGRQAGRHMAGGVEGVGACLAGCRVVCIFIMRGKTMLATRLLEGDGWCTGL